MFVFAVGVEQFEADLAAGRIACPDCGGPLALSARTRAARADAARRSPAAAPAGGVPPGRANTCVLLSAWSVPLRRDGTEVIIAALLAAAAKASHDRRAAGPSAGHGPRLAAARANDSSRHPTVLAAGDRIGDAPIVRPPHLAQSSADASSVATTNASTLRT
jgi:hypothetical protein